jgi:NAD(P)-dependent dehydrogenase (short-subunit alcohol dehydrogenase family)
MTRQVTLITGASSGIGADLARALAPDHDLILHGRDETRLENVRNSCARAGRHSLWAADLRSVEYVTSSLRDVIVRDGLIVEHFVHCAGVTAVQPIREAAPDEVHALFSVNVLSALAIVSVLPDLRAILFVSSVAALRGEKGAAVYSASKGALLSLARSLAVELGPSVRVNALAPGLVRTAMAEETIRSEGFAERVGPRYPLGIGETADVVAMAKTLLASESRWITGATWVADGGRSVI